MRDDELKELDDLTHMYCEVNPAGGSENIHGKVNILLQTYLSRGRVQAFSLVSDQSYISQVNNNSNDNNNVNRLTWVCMWLWESDGILKTPSSIFPS